MESVCLWLNDSEESPRPSKRQNKGPGDDISDIEHLLEDQPISEFTLEVHIFFLSLCLFSIVVSYLNNTF